MVMTFPAKLKLVADLSKIHPPPPDRLVISARRLLLSRPRRSAPLGTFHNPFNCLRIHRRETSETYRILAATKKS